MTNSHEINGVQTNPAAADRGDGEGEGVAAQLSLLAIKQGQTVNGSETNDKKRKSREADRITSILTIILKICQPERRTEGKKISKIPST